MRTSPKGMSVAAGVTAISALACCLPASLSAAAGIATLSIVLEPLRNWLIGLSVLFIAVGLLQLRRFKNTCGKPTKASVLLLGLAAIVVLGVSLFPQTIAVVLADLFP